MVPRLSTFKSVAGWLFPVAAAVALASCADGSMSYAPPAKGDAMHLTSRVYRLGVGDKVKITVFGEPDLSGPLEVNALGALAMPLVGDIQAKGRSIDEIKQAIVARLSDGYIKNPKVSVEVTNYRAFYVHGEVRNGGEFAFKPGLKLRDAIATAGGYTYRANTNYVVVTSEGASEARVGLPSDLIVLPGDNIRVPERFF
jgi:polysaccharide export outer membrane protein